MSSAPGPPHAVPPANGADEAAAVPAEPAPARRRRWPRRLLWLVLILVVARVALGFAARPLARAVAGSQGIDLSVERFDLSLFEGRLELWRLTAGVEREGEEALPLLAVQTLALDVDTAALFTGDLRVRRLEVDGVRVDLSRDAAGTWNVQPLLDRFARGPQEDEPPEPYEPAEISLEPPLEVVAARVQDISVHVRDGAVTPAVDTVLTVSISAADIGSAGRPARLDVVATSPQVLDLLRVRGDARTEPEQAQLSLDVELSGLRLRPLASTLSSIGIEPLAERIDGGLALELHATQATELGDRLQATLELNGVHLANDGTLALALDALTVDVAELWPRGADVREVLLEGLRGRAERLPDGGLALAGVAWRGAPDGAAPAETAEEPREGAGEAVAEAPAEPAPEASTDEDEAPQEPFGWSVERVQLTDGALVLDDRALAPEVRVEAVLEELSLGPLSPRDDAPPARLILRAAVPEVAGTVLLEGTVRPRTTAPEVQLSLDVEDVRLQRIAPYLAMAGIEPALEDGGQLRIETIELARAGERVASAGGALALRLGGVALRHGHRELGALDLVVLRLGGGPAPEGDHDVVVEGARVEIVREAGDAVRAMGLRFNAGPKPPSLARAGAGDQQRAARQAPAPEAGSQAASEPFELPELALPSASLQLERVVLDDEERGGEPLVLGPLTAVLTPAARNDGDAARTYALELEGKTVLSEELAASLRLTQAPDRTLTFGGEGRARGVDLGPLRPWLELVGLEPALAGGTLDGSFELGVEALDGEPVIDLSVGPLRMAETQDGEEREWLGLERLTVERLRLGDTVDLEALRVASPRIALQRDADGGLRALGLRLPPPEVAADTEQPEADAETSSKEAGALIAAADAEASARATEAVVPRAGAASPADAVATGPTTGAAAEDRSPPEDDGQARASSTSTGWGVRVGLVELSDAAARFDDLALAAPHALELGGDLRLGELEPGPGAAPTPIEGRLTLGGSELTTSGKLTLDPDDWRAALDLAGQGLNGEALAPYLPAGVAIDLRDGQAAGRVRARFAVAAEGGHAISLAVEQAELRERDAERPLGSLGALRLEAPRLDPEGAVFELDELALEGATLDVRRTSDGGVAALGVLLEPPSGTADEHAAPEATGPDESPAPAAEPVAQESTGTSGAAPPPLRPHVRVGKLDLELTELRVTGDGDSASGPVIGTGRLALRAPYEVDLDSDDAQDDPPPIGLDLAASLSPGVESLDLGLDLAPFADRPRLDARLAVAGLEGQGLLALAPELADRVDASGLSGGTFGGTLGAELSWRRRGPLDFDLGGGFGLELLVDGVALRPTPDAEVALGVDSVEAVVRRISPDTGSVHVARLDVDTPRAHVRRTPEALELAGLTIRMPAAPAEGTSEAGAAPAKPAGDGDGDPVVVAADEPATGAAPDDTGAAGARPATPEQELRIDELVVHGVDLHFEDLTTEPALVLPLDMLELEVRGFTTRALAEPIPLRLSALVGAGPVELPERPERRSLVTGLTSGVIGVVSGSEEDLTFEERPLFQEAALTARLTLYPYPEGWIRTSVTAFELTGLRPLARESGVEISDGVLDFTGRVQLEGQKGGSIESVSSFAHLSLSEPKGGPISRYLKLPAPLDTVLFTLENEHGEHRIPLDFDFGEGGQLSAGQIAAQASKTLLGLITEALASAPMRAVGGVTDVLVPKSLLGGGERKPRYAGKRVTLHFVPGGIRVGAVERKALDEVLEAMEEDPALELVAVHAFGPGDLERAERLASPETNEALTLVRSLRYRRDELTRTRDELAAQARAQLLLGQDEGFAVTRARLIAADRDLGLTQNGIDAVAELLRPGAENRKERRTRDAAMSIARTRMDGLSRLLLDAGVDYDRFDLRPPRLELAPEAEDDPGGRIVVVTRGGTPPKGFLRRMLGWVGL